MANIGLDDLKKSLVDKIFKAGEPDSSLRDLLALSNKDNVFYLCEKYLEFNEYKNETLSVVAERLISRIYEEGDVVESIQRLVDGLNENTLITYAKEYSLGLGDDSITALANSAPEMSREEHDAEMRAFLDSKFPDEEEDASVADIAQESADVPTEEVSRRVGEFVNNGMRQIMDMK
ncbi:MAG: hypothetical protein A3F91_09450 [Flavobacteria bacterium RIFCSPLOWO2_12_FULL_35_11]|nr:MAG: hypothetical protein A3F91_09450 [Flavobacteria bacterium RIFCSPLOWO2_12_FULL_35_11]